MSRIAFLLAAVVAITAGCKDDEKGNVELVFKAQYGGEPLVMFTDYLYAFNDTISFSKADFYLSNVKLIDESGNKDLLDVELVDLSFTNVAAAQEGYVIPLGEIEAKIYDRLDFIIGLDAEQNATRPDDHPSSSPLSLPRYWEPWSSYIFAKTEGTMDTLGGTDSNLGWAYHTGTDPMATGLSTNPEFEIDIIDGQTTRIVFTMDYRTVLGVGSDPIDIKRKPQNHNPNDTVELRKIVDNYIPALTFEVQ